MHLSTYIHKKRENLKDTFLSPRMNKSSAREGVFFRTQIEQTTNFRQPPIISQTVLKSAVESVINNYESVVVRFEISLFIFESKKAFTKNA